MATRTVQAEVREYHVEWMIDLDADSYESAARKALAIISNPESKAHIFLVSVHRAGNVELLIDLDEIDEKGD